MFPEKRIRSRTQPHPRPAPTPEKRTSPGPKGPHLSARHAAALSMANSRYGEFLGLLKSDTAVLVSRTTV